MATYLQSIENDVAGTPTTWLSNAIWDQFPSESVQSGATRGIFKVFDFMGDCDENEHRTADTAVAGVLSLPGWIIDIVEGGGGETTLDISSKVHGGVLTISPDAASDDGVQMQYAAPLALNSCDVVAVESRLKIADVTKTQHFLGVGNLDNTFFNAGANSGTDYVGFQSIGSATVTLATRKASGTASSTSLTGGTLVNDTYVKLGWRYIRAEGKVEAFVNGLLAGVYSSTEVPTSVLVYPTLVAQAEGTSGGDTTVDWIAFGATYSVS